VAKKTRTPAPPRKVQAPQRRSDPKGPSRFSERRGLWLLVAVAAVAVIAAIVAGVLLTRGGSNDVAAANVPNQSALAGLQTGPAPWNPGLDTLSDRLDPLGLNALTTEGQVLHIHQHLDLFVEGRKVTVPANVGIDPSGAFISDLHTHDTTGIIHVESPTEQQFTLGQFFAVWAVPLSATQIGSLKGERVRTWVDGKPVNADPTRIILAAHQEIVLAYGAAPKTVPSKYDFPEGL